MQKIKQTFNQKLNLSPQQIQFLGLLQIPIVDLEKRIEEEVEENPALEEEEEEEDVISEKDESGFLKKDQYQKTDFLTNNLTGNSDSLSDFLHKQLLGNKIEVDVLNIVEYLIDSLDDNGFLRRDLDSIINDYFISNEIEITREKLSDALKILKALEPAGVGSKDLQECLIIQVARKQLGNKGLLIKILSNYYKEFSNKNFEKMMKELEITEIQLSSIYKEVGKLNPIPGLGFSKNEEPIEYVVPDFSLLNKNGELIIKLNKSNTRGIVVSNFYKKLLAETKDAETKDFLIKKLEKANWFVDALRKRNETLRKVMEAIIKIQSEYFISGKENELKPMKLADIAEEVHLDISTISRVTNSKYIETVFGTFLLKDFFSEAYRKDSGELISTKEIKNKLKEIIQQENKNNPYTDEVLCQLLGQEEYHIARRTVAKYRDGLKIPSSKIRRSI